MGLLDHLISRRKAKPDQPDAITRLRKANYALEDLPETMAFPQRLGDGPREPLPVVEASVDEIAFAIVEAEPLGAIVSRTMANGTCADARLAVRQERSRPLVEGLHTWLLDERARLSKHNSVAKAIDYLMPPKGERWDAFTAFLDDGRICLTNNAAERALRGIALGRKSWLFAASERGGERAAFMYTLIVSCKMNDIDPQAWMADVLARMPNITVSRLPELLPWNWNAEQEAFKAA